MAERVSDEVLRRWVRTLSPGQAALCEELLELRAKVRRAEALAEVMGRIAELSPGEYCEDLDEELWAAWLDYMGRDDDGRSA